MFQSFYLECGSTKAEVIIYSAYTANRAWQKIQVEIYSEIQSSTCMV